MHAHLLVMLSEFTLENHYFAEEPNTATFVHKSIITFFVMPLNLVLMVIFMIIIHDLGTIRSQEN